MDELEEYHVTVTVLVDTSEPTWRQAALEQARDVIRDATPDDVAIEAA